MPNVPNVPTLQQCKLTWTILDWNGSPAAVVKTKFSSSVGVVYVAGNPVTLAQAWPSVNWIDGVMCDELGQPGVYVPATMDADMQPNGFSITVEATLTNGRKIRSTVATPVGGTIDLAEYVNAPEVPASAIPLGIEDVLGLQDALDAKPDDWDELAGKPATFPPDVHTHAIEDVTGLQTELDGKSATSHTHTASQVTDFATASRLIRPGIARYLHNWDRGKFSKWSKALQRVRTGGADAKMLFVGDSTTLGAGTTTPYLGSYSHWLNQELNRSFIPAAKGLSIAHMSPDARWTVGAGWNLGTAQGFGWATWPSTSNGYFDSTTNGATLTFTPGEGVEYDRFDVYVFEYTGTGTATIQATGGSAVNVTAGAQALSAGIVKKYTASAGSLSTTNSVTITRTNTTQLIVFAIEAWNSTKSKVRIANAGVSGTGTDAWAATVGFAPGVTPRKNIEAYQPDLTIIDLGINSAVLNRDPATVASELASIVTAAKVSGDVIYKTMLPTNNATTAAREAVFVTNMIASGEPVIDVFGLITAFGGGAAYNTAGFMFDTLHGNAFGYAEEAGWVLEALRRI